MGKTVNLGWLVYKSGDSHIQASLQGEVTCSVHRGCSRLKQEEPTLKSESTAGILQPSFFCGNRVSLCIPGCPGILHVDHAGLELPELFLPLPPKLQPCNIPENKFSLNICENGQIQSSGSYAYWEGCGVVGMHCWVFFSCQVPPL